MKKCIILIIIIINIFIIRVYSQIEDDIIIGNNIDTFFGKEGEREIRIKNINFNNWNNQKEIYESEINKVNLNNNDCSLIYNKEEGEEEGRFENIDNIFYYSDSYKQIDNDIINEEFKMNNNLTDDFKGLYTRYVFMLRSNSNNTFKNFKYNEIFNEIGFGESINSRCSKSINTFLGCREFETCQLTEGFEVMIEINNTKARYHLEKINLYDNFKYFPFTFYQLNNKTCKNLGEDNSCSNDCYNEIMNEDDIISDFKCNDNEITYDFKNDNDLINNCGNFSDPIGGFLNEYNTNCDYIYCSQCSNFTINDINYYQRFGIGPKVKLYKIGDVNLITDLKITIKKLDTNEIKEIILKNIEIGNTKLTDDKLIRLNINNIFFNHNTKKNSILPNIENSYLIIWGNFTSEEDENIEYIKETNDININPYPDYPNSNGYVPTINNNNISSDIGWAYINQTNILKLLPFLISQENLNNNNDLHNLNNCYNDFFTNYTKLAGWDLNLLNSNIISPCQISNLLNKLSFDYINMNFFTKNDLIGYHYLPPNYNLAKPNYYIYYNNLIFDLQNPNDIPFFDFSSLQQNSIKTNNYNTLNENLIELYIDISTQFINYEQKIFNNINYLEQTSCSFNINTTNSYLLIELINNSNFESNLNLFNYCFSNNTSIIDIQNPNNLQLNISDISFESFETKTFNFNFNLINVTNNFNYSQIPPIFCNSSITPVNDDNILKNILIKCINLTPQSPNPINITISNNTPSNCEWYDLDCNSTLFYISISFIVIFFIFFLILLIMLIIKHKKNSI